VCIGVYRGRVVGDRREGGNGGEGGGKEIEIIDAICYSTHSIQYMHTMHPYNMSPILSYTLLYPLILSYTISFDTMYDKHACVEVERLRLALSHAVRRRRRERWLSVISFLLGGGGGVWW
jgi:hypothetical protein